MLIIQNKLKTFQKKAEGLSFSRFEIKYILNKNLSQIIQDKISNFMSLDNFAKEFPNNKYFVRSLYYDSEKFINFHQKTDGLKIRYKFRIRTYSKELNKLSIIFLEKKGRFNERTYKIRKKIDNINYKLFITDCDKMKIAEKYKNDPLIGQFVFDCYRKKIKPKVIIDYYRKPYINKTGVYFRLTFDSQLNSIATGDLYPKNLMFKQTIPGYEILEVKFDRTIPPWFQKIIQTYNLKRLSVSKFVLGCETTELAYDYEGR